LLYASMISPGHLRENTSSIPLADKEDSLDGDELML
jgi:hypothetical protein